MIPRAAVPCAPPALYGECSAMRDRMHSAGTTRRNGQG